MSPLAALYVKELKELRMVAAFALATAAGIGLYAVAAGPSASTALAAMGLLLLTGVSALMLPALLVKSLTREWRMGTHYLLLSLPVGRAWPLLAKVAAHLSLGAALFLVSGLALHAVYVRLGPAMHPMPAIDPAGAWATAAALYFGLLVLVSGIACPAGVVRLLAPRFKGLATAATGLLGLWLHAEVKDLVLPHSGGIVEIVRWDPLTGMGLGYAEMIASLAVTCAVGLAYVALGAWLFARSAEA